MRHALVRGWLSQEDNTPRFPSSALRLPSTEEGLRPGESGFYSDVLANPYYFHKLVNMPQEEMEAK